MATSGSQRRSPWAGACIVAVTRRRAHRYALRPAPSRRRPTVEDQRSSRDLSLTFGGRAPSDTRSSPRQGKPPQIGPELVRRGLCGKIGTRASSSINLDLSGATRTVHEEFNVVRRLDDERTYRDRLVPLGLLVVGRLRRERRRGFGLAGPSDPMSLSQDQESPTRETRASCGQKLRVMKATKRTKAASVAATLSRYVHRRLTTPRTRREQREEKAWPDPGGAAQQFLPRAWHEPNPTKRASS